MSDKKKIDEAVTLTLNSEENGMQGSLTINANDEAELVQIIKNAGLSNMQGSASTLTVNSPDGKLSSTIQSPDVRSIMQLLRVTDENHPVSDVVTTDVAMGESAEDNDYGTEMSSRKGEVYAGVTSRPGTARADVRDVPARSGDNPLTFKKLKEYLDEVEYHKSHRPGDLRAGKGEYGDYWVVQQYNETQYGSAWIVPAWEEAGYPELAGEFASEEEANQAINSMNESFVVEYDDVHHRMGVDVVKDGDIAALSRAEYFNSSSEAGFVIAQYSSNSPYGSGWMVPAWEEQGRPQLAGTFPDKESAEAAIASDASVYEARDWRAAENRYGEGLALIPAGMNNTFDELEQNEYYGEHLANGEGSVIVIGKENRSSGKFTPRYCFTSGEPHYKIGANVTVVHDQTRATTPGKIMYQFSGKDYMENRDAVAAGLEAAGIPRRKKVPVKAFK